MEAKNQTYSLAGKIDQSIITKYMYREPFGSCALLMTKISEAIDVDLKARDSNERLRGMVDDPYKDSNDRFKIQVMIDSSINQQLIELYFTIQEVRKSCSKSPYCRRCPLGTTV